MNKKKSGAGGGSMKRREKYLRKCISALALAGMLMVSVRPLSASAESVPGADTREEAQELSAADLSGGNEDLQKGQNDSGITEEETPGDETEITGQAGEKENEKEEKANGSEDKQENPVQTQEESGQEDGGTDGTQNTGGGQQSEEDGGGMPAEQAFSQTDPATGICAEAAAGVFPAGTLMIVTPLTGGENYNLLQTLLSAATDQFQVYDISFFSVSLPDFSDMQPVQPGGNVKVRMPVPEEYDLSRLAVYHISTDGGMTPVSFVVQDGMAVFETDQFSLYALVEMKEMRTDLPPSLEMTDKISRLELNRAGENSTVVSSVPSEYTSPKTGDNITETDIIRQIATAAAALVCAAAILIRRRIGSIEK